MPNNQPRKATGEPRRVTIRDVAREAGVSIGTASTALTGSKTNVVLSKATRERVMRVARELRYRPHAAARAMAGRRTRSVAVLANEFCMSGSYYSNVLRGIAAEASDSGYHLILKQLDSDPAKNSSAIFQEHHIDGAIVPAEAESRIRETLLHYDIPHVWINTALDEPTHCLHVDEQLGMEQAVEHLYRLGHRRIAYIPHNVPDRHYATEARERGYLAAIRRRGLSPVATHDRHMNIAEHVDLYLNLQPRPTALLIYSDAMSLLALHRLIDRGIRVPWDMSIVGNEGVVLHEFAYRRLTTLRAPVVELGRAAVRMLTAQFDGDPAPNSIRLAPMLEINESTGPVPR